MPEAAGDTTASAEVSESASLLPACPAIPDLFQSGPKAVPEKPEIVVAAPDLLEDQPAPDTPHPVLPAPAEEWLVLSSGTWGTIADADMSDE
jgi:hypothetical protein